MHHVSTNSYEGWKRTKITISPPEMEERRLVLEAFTWSSWGITRHNKSARLLYITPRCSCLCPLTNPQELHRNHHSTDSSIAHPNSDYTKTQATTLVHAWITLKPSLGSIKRGRCHTLDSIKNLTNNKQLSLTTGFQAPSRLLTPTQIGTQKACNPRYPCCSVPVHIAFAPRTRSLRKLRSAQKITKSQDLAKLRS